VTRIYTLPQPPLRDPTPRDQELQHIRHRLSQIAARLTLQGERVQWALQEIERERARLRAIGKEKRE
jgi:hypothetical protein